MFAALTSFYPPLSLALSREGRGDALIKLWSEKSA
jgi:hypothetical protein